MLVGGFRKEPPANLSVEFSLSRQTEDCFVRPGRAEGPSFGADVASNLLATRDIGGGPVYSMLIVDVIFLIKGGGASICDDLLARVGAAFYAGAAAGTTFFI